MPRMAMQRTTKLGEGVRERLDDLLGKTSRTFALTIPLLPEPTRLEVTIAYLLFRVADTLEDAVHWSTARKLEELESFAALLEHPTDERAAELSRGVDRRAAARSCRLSRVAR